MELRCDHCNNTVRRGEAGITSSLCETCYSNGRGEIVWSVKQKKFIEDGTLVHARNEKKRIAEDSKKLRSQIRKKISRLTHHKLCLIMGIINEKMV